MLYSQYDVGLESLNVDIINIFNLELKINTESSHARISDMPVTIATNRKVYFLCVHIIFRERLRLHYLAVQNSMREESGPGIIM